MTRLPAMGIVAGVAALAGCDRLFGLASVEAVDVGSSSCVPLGHDEDLDGIDDACDNCPGVPNHDQADTAELAAGGIADGVGDACDPNPMTGGDRVVRFVSFSEPNIASRWPSRIGTWVFDGEAMNVTSSAGSGGSFDYSMLEGPDPTGAFTLEYGFELHGAGSGRFAAMVDAVSSGPGFAGTTCGVIGTTDIVLDVDLQSSAGKQASSIINLSLDTEYRARLWFDPVHGATCSIITNPVPPPLTTTFSPPLAASGLLGFEVQRPGSIDYIVVYAPP